MLPYKDTTQFRQDCQSAFTRHVQAGQDLYPQAKPSHLCIRSHTKSDFDQLALMGETLGDITEKSLSDSQKILFLHLQEPLIHQDYRIEWLEITAPKAEYPFTGPQMLVFADPTCEEPEKRNAPNHTFILRRQALSALQIVTG